MSITINEIKAEVRRLDPSLKDKDKAFKAAVALLAATCGLAPRPTGYMLTKVTGYPYSLVCGFVSQWKSSGVIESNKICCDWLNRRDRGIAFWCDVAVGLGYMRRKAAHE